MRARRGLAAGLVLFVVLAGAPAIQGAQAQGPPPGVAMPPGPTTPADSEMLGLEATPPRVAYITGEVSFWRPGAADWAPARVNTPLAPGDLLYTGGSGNVELQIGSRAFVRAAPGTQLGLENLESDFVQFRVASGHVSLDLRDLRAGTTIELDTPNAVFTVERTGYYRVSVGEDATAFITRRGGRATMTTTGGPPVVITPSEHIVVTGTDPARVETYVAPELSAWDRWNYARTDYLIEAVSARYVPSGVYGAGDLDRHGAWRVTQDYGAVWVPDGMPLGWAPYSTGRWLWDPRYQWTWVDDAPWGWAPYHYGRWVHTGGFWAWAPGPIVVRPIYAPALVAFFGGLAFGRPLGWVALGWGEPCIPWWGRPGFIGAAWWGGWGGPRVVNNVVVHHTTVVNVKNITIYKNVSVTNAVVAVPHERFGRDHVSGARVTKVDVQGLAPVHGALDVKPVSASVVAATGPSVRPPDAVLKRSVVATRAPRDIPTPVRPEGPAGPQAGARPPAPRLVPPPSGTDVTATSARPPFGQQSAPERPRPAEPPRLEGPARTAPSRGEVRPAPVEGTPSARTGRPSRPEGEGVVTPPAEAGRRMPTQPGGERRAERPGAPATSPAPAPPPSVQAQPPRAQSAPSQRPQAQAPQAQAPSAPRIQAPPEARPRAPQSPPSQAPAAPSVRADRSDRPARALPGDPANRLYPGQPEKPASKPADKPQRKVEPQKQPSSGGGSAPDAGGQRGRGRD